MARCDVLDEALGECDRSRISLPDPDQLPRFVAIEWAKGPERIPLDALFSDELDEMKDMIEEGVNLLDELYGGVTVHDLDTEEAYSPVWKIVEFGTLHRW